MLLVINICQSNILIWIYILDNNLSKKKKADNLIPTISTEPFRSNAFQQDLMWTKSLQNFRRNCADKHMWMDRWTKRQTYGQSSNYMQILTNATGLGKFLPVSLRIVNVFKSHNSNGLSLNANMKYCLKEITENILAIQTLYI